MESKILELQKMVSKYKTTWSQIQEQMNEFTLVYVARWRGKDGKRYASPFKTKDSAEKRAKELRTQGNSEVSVTQDTLKGNIKWAKDNGPDIKGMQKEAIVEDGHEDVSSSKRMAQVIAEDAQLIIKELNKKSEEESLPTWWTNKLAVSAHNMNAARDYIVDNIKEDLEEAMSDAQLKKVRDSYKDLKTISPEKVKTLRNFLDRYSTDSLMQLAQANINFVSTMARSVMNKRKIGDPKHAGSMKEETKTDSERIADLRTKQMMLQTKVREMDPTKDKTDVEIAKNKLDNIQLRMDKIKSQNEEVELQEKIEGLANKSEKSGVPYGILKKVYDRGMAAWKGGHRPGTTPQQWAFARVNSFLTGGKTRTTADADLWQKAKAAKSKK